MQGIILAHCNDAGDAGALVQATKYPPRGVRGAASASRASRCGYGRSPRAHVEHANQETLCFGLIEAPQAVPNVPAMLAVEGFDGCFLGGGDNTSDPGKRGILYYEQSALDALVARAHTAGYHTLP